MFKEVKYGGGMFIFDGNIMVTICLPKGVGNSHLLV